MMENFSQWWDSLSEILKVLYCIAFPSTLLLVIQTTLTVFFGMHHHGLGGHDISDTSGLDMHVDAGGHDIGGHNIIDIHHDAAAFHDLSAHNSDAGFHDHSYNDSVSDTSMHLFTMQTIVAFFTVSSWTSIVLIGSQVPKVISLAVGFILGAMTMVVIAKMMQLSMKLTENGTVDLRNAIGESATVYIPCPPKNSGMGKVTMTLQGQMMELGAFNEGDETLATGTKVIVVDVRGDDVIVEKDA